MKKDIRLHYVTIKEVDENALKKRKINFEMY